MNNKKKTYFLPIIFVLAFIVWINSGNMPGGRRGCKHELHEEGHQSIFSCSELSQSDEMKKNEKIDELEKRTGKRLKGWTWSHLIELERELNRLEAELERKMAQELPKEPKDASEDMTAKKEDGAAYYEDQAAEEKTIDEIQAPSNMPCQEIIGTWSGEYQHKRLTGTTTWEQHGKSETIDVNEIWDHWLEEPESMEIQIWTENNQCFAKMFDGVADVTYQNGNIELIAEPDFWSLGVPLSFKGSLVQPGKIVGSYEWPNPLGDEGAMIFGDWWVLKTE